MYRKINGTLSIVPLALRKFYLNGVVLEYIVTEYTTVKVTTTLSVPLGSIPELPAKSCQEIKANEESQVVSGKYWFYSIIPGTSVFAYCNMPDNKRYVKTKG